MLWLYVIFAFGILVYEALRKREVLADWMSMLNLFAGIYYIAVPLAHLYSPDGFHWRALSAFPLASDSVWVFLAVTTAHMAVIIGFELGSSLKTRRVDIELKWTDERFIFIYGCFVVLGFALLSIVMTARGEGIVRSLLMASDVRAGRASRGLLDYAQYAFEVAPMMLLLVLGSSKASGMGRLIRFPLITIVFLSALYLALMSAGRGKLLTPFLLAYLLWINTVRDGKRAALPFVTLTLGVVGVLVVTYGKAAFWELDSLSNGPQFFIERVLERQTRLYGDASLLTAIAALLGQFDHYVVSLYLAIDRPDAYEVPRMFLDWPRAAVSYAPGLDQPDFVVTSTAAGHGRELLRNAGMLSAGYVPPGWVGMHYINMMWAGIAAVSFVSGAVAGVLHKVLWQNFNRGEWIGGLYVAVGWLWIMYGFGADPFTAVPALIFTIAVFFPIIAAASLRLRK